jgi:pyridoxamine 5'-phosphate oxidase family protein
VVLNQLDKDESEYIMFTDNEIAYLKSQPLARLATVSITGQPDVVPVGFEFDGKIFYIGGHNPSNTRKYKNVRNGNSKVALVVDDLVSVNPWNPRGIRIYGVAEFVERNGRFGPGEYMRITPTRSWSWNLGDSTVTRGRLTSNRNVNEADARERTII